MLIYNSICLLSQKEKKRLKLRRYTIMGIKKKKKEPIWFSLLLHGKFWIGIKFQLDLKGIFYFFVRWLNRKWSLEWAVEWIQYYLSPWYLIFNTFFCWWNITTFSWPYDGSKYRPTWNNKELFKVRKILFL